MKYEGNARKFGDYVNTDYIISGRYKFSITDPEELSKHMMEDIRPGFYSEIQKGDFIVADRDFGCGSSREQAPLVIKTAGINAVIAESFARIFYRNCINLGVPVIECDTSGIEENDKLILDMENNQIKNLTKNTVIKTKKIPQLMKKFLDQSGAVEYYRKHGRLEL